MAYQNERTGYLRMLAMKELNILRVNSKFKKVKHKMVPAELVYTYVKEELNWS